MNIAEEKTTIIGIDCAVNEKNVGIAVGEFSTHGLVLKFLPSREESSPMVRCICTCIARPGRILLAFDAPLGWPDNMGRSLARHSAGMHISTPADLLFRRETDRFVKECLSKQPLDVGADRIARTAHAALDLLEKIRSQSGQEIPLAWDPGYEHSVTAIEVYPAGTLIAHGLPSSGYKKKDQLEVRQFILSSLKKQIVFETDTLYAENNDNVLDAIICVLAGSDFLSGQAISPVDLKTAQKEGWIWIKRQSFKQ